MFYSEKRRAIGGILRKLCERKTYGFWWGFCADNIYGLEVNLFKMSESGFIGYLKGKAV